MICLEERGLVDMDQRPKDLYIALDQATKCTGYSVFYNGKLVDHGIHSAKGYEKERIANMRNWLQGKIDAIEIKYNQKLDMLVLEDIQMHHGDVITFKTLAHLQGVLVNLAYENKMKTKIYFASSWRHGIGIKGTGKTIQKKNAQIFTKNNFGLDVSNDEADAICIGEHENRERNKEINFE